MIVECKHCGAPLDVERGSAFARCGYCGHTNKVKSAKTLMAESPASWAPPPVWQPPPQYSAPHVPLPYRPPASAAPAKKGCLAPVLGGLVLLGISAAILWGSGIASVLPFVGLEVDGAPTAGTVDLGQPTRPPIAGVAGGSYGADQLGSACRGWLPRAPHALLRATAPTSVRLDVARVDTDLVMALRTSEGTWICDDDSGGSRMPRIVTTVPAGDHRVWVGTFSQSESSAFVLMIDAQPTGGQSAAPSGIAPDAPPSIGTLAVGAERVTGSWNGTTSGWVEARTLAAHCRGWLPVAPHLAITTSAPRAVQLVTADNGDLDLVMLVRAPSGAIQCDDDSGGSLNPRVHTTLEVGTTHVWVGSFHDDRRGSFRLDVSEPGP